MMLLTRPVALQFCKKRRRVTTFGDAGRPLRCCIKAATRLDAATPQPRTLTIVETRQGAVLPDAFAFCGMGKAAWSERLA
jgi:hypothetical protein